MSSSTATKETTAYRFGELTPWTEGDSAIAVEHSEPFGCTLLLQDIVDADDNVIARVEYLPCANDEENEAAHRVLDSLNTHDSLRAEVRELREAAEFARIRLLQDSGDPESIDKLSAVLERTAQP